jgi:hypothetical protein
MTVSITVNKLTLCHKGDGMGTVTATVPDVCKTPPSAAPVPYPNIAFATDLAGGTTTVFVDGGNMAAHSASVFSKSIGDEPGTLGGVKSGVNKAEASWISYSMDVFLEGLNASRLTDKMLLNHGNTVSMGGFMTNWLKSWLNDAKKGTIDCDALVDMIDKILNNKKGTGSPPWNSIRGVKERYFDQINGSMLPGSKGWADHEDQFNGVQKQLRDYLQAHEDHCRGGPPAPADALEWATKPAPTSADYRGPAPAPAPAPSSSSSSINWGAVGVVVVGGIIVLGLIFAPEITVPALAAGAL